MTFAKPHSSNLAYLAICALCIFAFIFVGIYPNQRALGQLDEEIAGLQVKVQSQELLHPVYMKLIRQMQQKAPEGLPLPEKRRIDRKNIASVNDSFRTLARNSGVVLESASPDPSSYLEDTNRLTMNVAFSGDFFNIRELLMNVCKMPFLNIIENMELTTVDGKKQIRLKLILDQQ